MEIELKMRLAPADLAALKADPLIADARGKRGVRKRLDNIYFDTPDRALANARIGLRLRKDGRRWLQTVKSGGSAQGGLHSRDEIEFAVAGKALEWPALKDTAMQDFFEPLKAALKPAFRTRFVREIRVLHTPGGGEIELAIDEGEVIAGTRREPICEVELELKSGEASALFDLALALASRHALVLSNVSKAERGDALARRAALAPPMKAAELDVPADASAHEVARGAIANCLAHWRGNEPGFVAQAHTDSYDSEYLHQLRVAIRRLRVALDPLARLAGWPADALQAVKKPLQQLGQRLGAARDWDVFTDESWPALAERLDDGGLRMALREAIDLQRALAQCEARAALENRETQRALLVLGRCMAPPAKPEPVADGAVADSSFEPLHAQFDDYAARLAQGAAALDELKPDELHAVRIVAKKMRYLIEFTAARHDATAVQAWLKWLKKTQELLGESNDRSTAFARLDALAKLVSKRHGKVKHTLHAALQMKEAPRLKLPPLPPAYWR